MSAELFAGLAALALAPFVLVVVTSFVKVAVVLGVLRNAVGLRDVPSNHVITAVALVLAAFISAPVAEAMWASAAPIVTAEGGGRLAALLSAAPEIVEPLRLFLLEHADPAERAQLFELAVRLREGVTGVLTAESISVLVPAFVLTELHEAFAIGFLLFVPFLVLDLVVASVLVSLGMQGLPAAQVSLPFKLLLFVLVDGWSLVAHGLVEGYL